MEKVEIEIKSVKEELSKLKHKLEKVELQLEKGTDAKGAPLSAKKEESLEEEKKVLNQQIAGLQEEKNLLLKQSGKLIPGCTLAIRVPVAAAVVNCLAACSFVSVNGRSRY